MRKAILKCDLVLLILTVISVCIVSKLEKWGIYAVGLTILSFIIVGINIKKDISTMQNIALFLANMGYLLLIRLFSLRDLVVAVEIHNFTPVVVCIIYILVTVIYASTIPYKIEKSIGVYIPPFKVLVRRFKMYLRKRRNLCLLLIMLLSFSTGYYILQSVYFSVVITLTTLLVVKIYEVR